MRQERNYEAIQELLQETSYSIRLLCEVAGTNRGAYYKWLQRKDTKEDQWNKTLVKAIKRLYKKLDGTFGYRRMTAELKRKYKCPINKKRIYRLMDKINLKAVIRRKAKQYKTSKPEHIAANILNRDFKAHCPNEKWVTDVTEFKYGEGKKAYLSAILDLHEKRIVRYNLTRANNNELVFKNLNEALETLSEDEHPLIHTDRGVQYTSYGFNRIIESAGLHHSMSRPGKCIDNGPMEAFWGNLKCEKYYLHKHEYQTFQQLAKAIEEYIYFYNYERLQLANGGYTPMEY
ncbi:IS3 family transposase, partial [Gracilibacillus thailandensis]